MSKIPVTIQMDADELWSEVFGSFGGYYPDWIHEIRFVTGSWKKHGLCYITAESVDDSWAPPSDTKVHRVYVEDIAKAYGALMNMGWKHCGGCGVDDPDACTSDAVLQHAVYGKFVFG